MSAPSSLGFSKTSLAILKGIAISGQTPTLQGSKLTSCTVSPALPAGLSLDTSTCALSGTPTTLSSLAVYTITAQNSAGQASTTIALAVLDPADFPAHTVAAKTAEVSQVSLTWAAPTAVGGESVVSYKIHSGTSSGFTVGSGNLIATVNAASTSYVDSTAVNGTGYFYKVVAVFSNAVEASASIEVRAQPQLAAAAADMNNIFVSTTGDDTTGDGSSSAPYATLAKAITEASAGAVINVADGTYALAADLAVSKSLTIRSLTGDYRTSAVNLEESPVGAARSISLTNSNTSLVGLNLRNVRVAISGGLSDISIVNNYVHDVALTWLHYSGVPNIPNFLVHGNYFKNVGSRTGAGGLSQTASVLNYWPDSDLSGVAPEFSHNKIESPGWSGFQILNTASIRIIHNQFIDTCDNAIQYNISSAAYSTETGTVDIAYNSISQSNKAGGHASCTGAGLLVYNSTNFGAGLNFKFTFNSVTSSDLAMDFSQAGCDFSTNSPSVSIFGNQFAASNSAGLNFNNCSGSLSVSKNFWGASSGPNGNGNSGSGLTISTTSAAGTLTSSLFLKSGF